MTKYMRQGTPDAVDVEDEEETKILDTAVMIRRGHPGTVELGLLDEVQIAAAPPAGASGGSADAIEMADGGRLPASYGL